MAWGQATQKAECKDCGQGFDSKMVFGEFTKRCEDCKVAKGTKMSVRTTHHYFDATYGMNKPCGGTADGKHQLNPGGYCNRCRAGGDFS